MGKKTSMRKARERKEKNHSKIQEAKNSLPNLPEHVIFRILATIPPEDLFKNFRCICKSWCDYILSSKFIAEQNTVQTELVIQVPWGLDGNFFETEVLVMDEKELAYKLNNFVPCQYPKFACSYPHERHGCKLTASSELRLGRISSSCNGLLLVNDPKVKGWLYVVNLVTKCHVILPPCPSGCRHKNCGSALLFNPRNQEYKVVHIYADGFGFETFTLGCSDNAWKRIPGPFEDSLLGKPSYIRKHGWSDPVTINGQVMHWHVGSDKFIISLDMNGEKPTKTGLPKGIGSKHKYEILEFGGNLSCISNVSPAQTNVWILEDFREEKWLKKYSIDKEFIRYTNWEGKNNKVLPKISKLVAVAALRNGEVLMFKQKDENCRVYLYDINKMELKELKMKVREARGFIPHKRSLVSWKTKEELLPLDLKAS